jgi:hypothetical protein
MKNVLYNLSSGEYEECTEADAICWSDYMFLLLEKNRLEEERKKLIEVACACLAKVCYSQN